MRRCSTRSSPSVRRHEPADAAAVLGLGPTQTDEVVRDAALPTAPTARADQVYSGVLYEALDLGSLDAAARRRATGRLAITSGLFGLLRPSDRVPAYRLSGQVSLPGLGTGGTALGPASRAVGRGGGRRRPRRRPAVVGVRAVLATAKGAPRAVVTVRVLHEADGRRTVVSHFNKATKGRLVRDLLVDGASPRRPGQLADLLADLGWKVEPDRDGSRRPRRLDVVVTDLGAGS